MLWCPGQHQALVSRLTGPDRGIASGKRSQSLLFPLTQSKLRYLLAELFIAVVYLYKGHGGTARCPTSATPLRTPEHGHSHPPMVGGEEDFRRARRPSLPEPPVSANPPPFVPQVHLHTFSVFPDPPVSASDRQTLWLPLRPLFDQIRSTQNALLCLFGELKEQCVFPMGTRYVPKRSNFNQLRLYSSFPESFVAFDLQKLNPKPRSQFAF